MKFASAILSFALVGLASAQVSILETVINSPVHNTLEAAVVAADPAIASLLGDENVDLTLFAPDDDAFLTLPAGTVDLLVSDSWSQTHLTCVLQGHVYADGAVPSSDIPMGGLSVESAEPDYFLNLTVDNTTAAVNGIEVTAADIIASNGIIHSISDGVLLPACVTQNIPAALEADGSFTTLLSLVEAAGLGDALSGPPTAEGLTLMAPNDDAFAAVPQEVIDYLGSNTTALTEVLTYHVIGFNVVPEMSGSVPTLQGEDISVTVEGETITLNDDSQVIDTTLASNGIIHEISGVLIPSSVELPQEGTMMPTTPVGTMMPTTPVSSILETVINSPVHNTLEDAVVAADPAIASLLGNENADLTLFAPDDDAFLTLPAGTVELLVSDSWSQTHLTCVLQGHVYTGRGVPSSDIPMEGLSVESAEPDYFLNLTVDNTTVSVNGIEVTAADIIASNGIIHSISDGVLLPACVTQNIPAALEADGSFTTLLSLVEAAGLGDALSGPPTSDGLTLMAPNDAAFAAVPQEVIDYLGSNTTALTEVLTYHVIEFNVIPEMSGSVPTLQGEDISVTVEGETITLNDDSQVIDTTLASNGIIHAITGVLIPSSVELPQEGTMTPTTMMPTNMPETSGATMTSSTFAAVVVCIVTLLG